MADVTENVCAEVDEQYIQDILLNDYGFIDGQIRKLDGYDDKNFHITDAKSCSEGIKFPSDGVILKFVNSVDSSYISLMEAQTKLMQFLGNSDFHFPMPMLNKHGQSFRSLEINGKVHVVRMTKYINGDTMSNTIADENFAEEFGSCVGYLTKKLQSFDHEGFHRENHIWALEYAGDALKFVNVFEDKNQQNILNTVLKKFQSEFLSKKDILEKSVIHGDLSFNNILATNNKITAIIDFGDVLYSYTFFELAIALCYMIAQEYKKKDPCLSNVPIKTLIEAYQRHRKLTDVELSLLHISVCARLCQSLILGKKTSLRDLSNVYVLSIQKIAWRTLQDLINDEEQNIYFKCMLTKLNILLFAHKWYSDEEFESADEGNKNNDGWEVENDFDLSNGETLENNPSKIKAVSLENPHIETISVSNNLSSLKLHEDQVQVTQDGGNLIEQTNSSITNSQSNNLIDFSKLAIDKNSNSNKSSNENVENKSNYSQVTTSQAGWGSWSSNWSVNSFLSTASALTNQVSQGLNNVIDASMGAPTPESLVSINKDEKDYHINYSNESNHNSSGSILNTDYFMSNVNHLTKIFESTGSKLINGGLDTLETVGKKTLEVLQEGDPGLRKKRALFSQKGEKINLSQILQEAKEKAEVELNHNNQESEIQKGYAYMFDHFQGVIHLESLELISKQSQMKLQTVLLTYSGTKLSELQDEIEHVKNKCCVDYDEDEKLMNSDEFIKALNNYVKMFGFDLKINKILKISDEIEKKTNNKNNLVDNAYDNAISGLAELTAAAIEIFYKIGEMLMIDTQKIEVTKKIETVICLYEAICCRIRSIANNYACLLSKIDDADISSQISDIYLESSNSSSYIQDALQLLIPILQLLVI
ncbi:uncharacterized protein LOC126894131 isoform X2 [Daktulosphaira vitifoliae]|uniref:uncharacterized protein LOC126894131 isoform X2 n=1 Tax=Daktulosphaira vitifoliae TaxID=58002 RepID=UPI0021A9C0A2|nr:uncharacterized protein LOC126894131 isoform X2 [Daktulosphaira vitifoliae]